jgi:hypothetical protein
MDSKKIIDPDGFVSQYDCDDMECTNNNCIRIKNNWNNLLLEIMSIMKRIDSKTTSKESKDMIDQLITANAVITALLDTIEGHK